jgi:hypothetical protein
MIGAPVPATAALAVRAWLGTARMTSGLIAQLPACPATEQCLGDTRIKALGAHGRRERSQPLGLASSCSRC